MMIQIEEKKYSDRSEFRIKVDYKYLRYWESDGNGGGYTEYCYTAYRNSLFMSYAHQKRICLEKCNKLIRSYKKKHEKPRVIIHEKQR